MMITYNLLSVGSKKSVLGIRTQCKENFLTTPGKSLMKHCRKLIQKDQLFHRVPSSLFNPQPLNKVMIAKANLDKQL